jgi:hypothetical protein
MHTDNTTYEAVAKCCHSYVPSNENDSYSNSVSDTPTTVSCVNCKHFSNDCHCELDLYDKIVAKHNF